MRKATLNEWGDLVCPGCRVNIITPPEMEVVAGRTDCRFCHCEFEVDEETAANANLIAEAGGYR